MSGLRVLRALVLLSTLAGCGAGFSPDGERRYACERGEAERDCPGDWGCGVDGYCFDPAQGAALACESAADCGGGWKCGLEGRCIDPQKPQNYRCESTALHCAEGWNCGPAGFCYELASAGAVACRAEREADGGVGDCAPGWRCGPSGVCADTRGEALRPVGGTPVAARVSPVLAHGVALEASVDDTRGGFVPAGSWPGQDVALPARYSAVVDAQGVSTLVTATVDGGPFFADVRRLPLPGARDVLVSADHTFALQGNDLVDARWLPNTPSTVVRTPLPFAADGLRLVDAQRLVAFGRSASGPQLYMRDVVTNPWVGQPLVSMSPGARIYDLASANARNGERFSGPGFLLATSDDGLFSAERYADGTWARFGSGSVEYNTPDLQPVQALQASGAGFLSNVRCGSGAPVPPGQRLGRVAVARDDTSPADGYAVAVEVVRTDGGVSDLLVLSRPVGNVEQAPNCSTTLFTQRGRCAACPAGSTLTSFRPLTAPADGGVATVEVRCLPAAPADGGLPAEAFEVLDVAADGGCGRAPATQERGQQAALPEPVPPAGLPATASPGAALRPTWTDATGTTWLVRHFTEQDLFPGPWTHGLRDALTLPTAPTSVYGATGSRQVARVGSALYERVPGAGWVFARVFDPEFVCSGVRGRGDLVVGSYPPFALTLRHNGTRDTRGLAHLQSSGDVTTNGACTTGPSPDVQAEVAVASDGTRHLLVAGNDRIWSLPEAQLPAEQPAVQPVVPVRLVPLPYGRIQHLTSTRPPAGGSELLAGYVVAQERLFRFRAVTLERWDVHELDYPENARVAGLWADGAAGRLAARDGRVWGLPSVTRLGPPLPELAPEVRSLAAVCGQAWALSGSGRLYRLQAVAGQAEGAWVPQDAVVQALAGGGRDDLVGGLLQADARVLRVFSRRGQVVEVQEPACE